MLKIKTALYCLIGLMVAGIAFVSYHHLREEPKALLSALPKNTDVSLNHIHHVATRDGVKEWTLDAETAQLQKADNKTLFKDISATFFLNDGNTLHLNSRDGVLMTDSKDMEVWGDVVVRNGGYEFNAEKLLYDHKSHTISTKTPIVIKGKGMEVTGDSMTFNLQTEQVMVLGRVIAVFESCTL